MQYNKPPLSIADQISRLRERGLLIPDTNRAMQILNSISYYRLRAYTYPFQDNKNSEHQFIRAISFDEILQLYEFDRSLRIIVFDAIERIEIALRTQIVYHYAMSYGCHWYENKKLYRNYNHFEKDFKNLLNEINRSEEIFIQHYKTTYTIPANPPAWMSLEVVSLGTLSKIYKNLHLGIEKKTISGGLGISHPFVLENWLHAVSDIRNICAHHSRLYNRSFVQSIKIPDKLPFIWIDDTSIHPNKTYIAICVLLYLLDRIIPGHDFRKKIENLFQIYPFVNPSVLNFPDNWKNEKFWQL